MSTIEKGYKIPSHFGTNYIVVEANGTNAQNAQELNSAYSKATNMSPSSGNTITIMLSPGTYDFGSTNYLNMNTQWINIESMTGYPDVIFTNGTDSTTVCLITTINITLKGVKAYSNRRINLSSGLSGAGGTNSNINVYNCVAGNRSFGYSYNTDFYNYSNFYNCIANDYSFCSVEYYASSYNYGTFVNCTANSYSFNFANNATARNYSSGKFINCTATGDYCFNSSYGTDVYDEGEYINCIGVNYSFTYPYNSVGNNNVFYRNCYAVTDSFQISDAFYGRAMCCVMSSSEFGARSNGVSTGSWLYYCRDTSGKYDT